MKCSVRPLSHVANLLQRGFKFSVAMHHERTSSLRDQYARCERIAKGPFRVGHPERHTLTQRVSLKVCGYPFTPLSLARGPPALVGPGLPPAWGWVLWAEGKDFACSVRLPELSP